jgi:hypothetical protein
VRRVDNDFEVEESIVGGFGLSYQRVPLAKYRYSWPLARLDFGSDRLRLRPRRPWRYGVKPVVITYAELTHVDVDMGRFTCSVVFRSSRDDVDGAEFVTFRPGCDRSVQLLREKGIHLEQK